jgi:hypothetical protein
MSKIKEDPSPANTLDVARGTQAVEFTAYAGGHGFSCALRSKETPKNHIDMTQQKPESAAIGRSELAL